MKHLGSVMLAAAFVLPATAADQYKAGANAIACNDKPAMIEFVKAIHTDQLDLAVSIADRARRAGADCTVISEGELIVGQPSGFGLIYLPEGGYYSAMDGFDAAARIPMKGGWNCHEPIGVEKEMGRKGAANADQGLTLTKTPAHTVLGLHVSDFSWMMANTIEKIVLSVDGGKPMTRISDLGHPEIPLDDELTNALKRGMKVSVSIVSEQGNTHRLNAHLIGFTRAYDCVQEPF